MISDEIHVSSGGKGFEEALAQAEKTAAFHSLGEKQALQLRLLAEEMLGMMRALTGEREADFRIEAEGDRFRLRLRAVTQMNPEKREKLLSVSTTGANAAAKGFLRKLRDLFERALEAADSAGAFSVSVPAGAEANPSVWTLTDYKQTLREDGEAWDELERSVISRIADEVEIGISGRTVEMTVHKTF